MVCALHQINIHETVTQKVVSGESLLLVIRYLRQRDTVIIKDLSIHFPKALWFDSGDF